MSFSALGAEPPAHHGPLQRWLGCAPVQRKLNLVKDSVGDVSRIVRATHNCLLTINKKYPHFSKHQLEVGTHTGVPHAMESGRAFQSGLDFKHSNLRTKVGG